MTTPYPFLCYFFFFLFSRRHRSKRSSPPPHRAYRFRVRNDAQLYVTGCVFLCVCRTHVLTKNDYSREPSEISSARARRRDERGNPVVLGVRLYFFLIFFLRCNRLGVCGDLESTTGPEARLRNAPRVFGRWGGGGSKSAKSSYPYSLCANSVRTGGFISVVKAEEKTGCNVKSLIELLLFFAIKRV